MKTDPTAPRKHLHRFDYLWLAYLVFYFIDPFMRRSLVFWMECLGYAAVMVALYIGVFRFHRTSVRMLCILGIVLLGVASYPTNAGAIAFYIYTAALLPFVVASAPRVFLLLIADAALLLGEGWLCHQNPLNSFLGVFFILVVGGSNIFFAQKQRADCKLRMAHEEIKALAAVAERERIARDLHDVLGHTLSVIALKAELAGRLLGRNAETARAAEEIGDVERIARAALAEVRETIGGYRARGFAAEIDDARNALTAAGVKLELESVPAPGSLRPAEESVLALAVREAVTNVVRHAQAQTCTLRFATEDGHRTLVIEDDGQHASLHEGNGLRGMRERVESLGGTLQLQREHGTRLMIELPATARSAS